VCTRDFNRAHLRGRSTSPLGAMSRRLSWLFALAAYVLPPVWAAFALDADMKTQRQVHGFVCGLPLLGIMFVACIASAALSVLGTAFGVASFCAAPAPRSLVRVAELAALVLPFLAASTYVALLLGA
jgi:hypothetical protein